MSLFVFMLLFAAQDRPKPQGNVANHHERMLQDLKLQRSSRDNVRQRIDNVRQRPIAPVNRGIDRTRNYHERHGHKFPHWHPLAGHRFYVGHNHHHWTSWRFSARHGCYLYWDNWTGKYYYWCAPDSCYYPVDYVPYGRFNIR